MKISDELRAKLAEAIAESDALGPSIVSANAAQDFHAIKGQPAVAVRSYDQQGRRVTNFIALETSPGLDAVVCAEKIAMALGLVERLATAHPAALPSTPAEKEPK